MASFGESSETPPDCILLARQEDKITQDESASPSIDFNDAPEAQSDEVMASSSITETMQRRQSASGRKSTSQPLIQVTQVKSRMGLEKQMGVKKGWGQTQKEESNVVNSLLEVFLYSIVFGVLFVTSYLTVSRCKNKYLLQ